MLNKSKYRFLTCKKRGDIYSLKRNLHGFVTASPIFDKGKSNQFVVRHHITHNCGRWKITQSHRVLLLDIFNMKVEIRNY